MCRDQYLSATRSVAGLSNVWIIKPGNLSQFYSTGTPRVVAKQNHHCDICVTQSRVRLFSARMKRGCDNACSQQGSRLDIGPHASRLCMG